MNNSENSVNYYYIDGNRKRSDSEPNIYSIHLVERHPYNIKGK